MACWDSFSQPTSTFSFHQTFARGGSCSSSLCMSVGQKGPWFTCACTSLLFCSALCPVWLFPTVWFQMYLHMHFSTSLLACFLPRCLSSLAGVHLACNLLLPHQLCVLSSVRGVAGKAKHPRQSNSSSNTFKWMRNVLKQVKVHIVCILVGYLCSSVRQIGHMVKQKNGQEHSLMKA